MEGTDPVNSLGGFWVLCEEAGSFNAPETSPLLATRNSTTLRETLLIYTNLIAKGVRKKKREFWYVGIVDHSETRELNRRPFQPRQTRFQEFYEGDVLLDGPVWSDEMDIDVLKSTNPFKKPARTRVKVVRRFQTARIYPNYESTVTLVTIEPEAKEDKEIACLLRKEIYQAYSNHRSARLAQMLGVVKSEMPAFVLHKGTKVSAAIAEADDLGIPGLASGLEFVNQYPTDGIVYTYLLYTHNVAVQALRADKTSTFPVTWWFDDWMFNLENTSWHFDVASASIGEWVDERSSRSPIPLPQGTQPQLDVDDITTSFEKTFGDVLYLYASAGSARKERLSGYATHDLLTFGSVVDWRKEIVGHFSSTPTPEWHFENKSRNIRASYSTKVPSRVDFELYDTHDPRLDLHFSLRLPMKERTRLRAAYLSQHHTDIDSLTYFVDEIGFSLVGNLSHTPSTTARPAYLLVPPLLVDYINGMCCIHHPLPDSLFYWASDPRGKDVIPEESWNNYGIPELEVQNWIGSCWPWNLYNLVRNHLRDKGYGSDGKRYARDKGYPELLRGDPHDRRMVELEDSDSDETCYSEPQLTSPSTFSLVDMPITSEEDDHSKGSSLPARLAKGFRLWMNNNADMSSPRKGKHRVVSSERSDSDNWDLVKSEDL
ncbi:hypothetical protein PQX77_015910 [Marasmius sp. AFHP31]|nr:hypothetical protein PQX77_015910 [Marasmius sp. AFHP31]